MSEARAAAGLDRLPWLADEPKPIRKKQGKRDRAGWGVAAALIVAGLSIWIPSALPTRDGGQPEAIGEVPPAASVTLPEPRPAPTDEAPIGSQPQIVSPRVPEVRPTPVREVRIAPPPKRLVRERVVAPRAGSIAESGQAVKAAPTSVVPVRGGPSASSLRPWSPRVTQGAAGRLVQIGAYGSRIQAKHGWWSMVRAYPAMRRLPALVVETRNSRGRAFYRFQVGTTSQAHSEVMCQRMQRIGLSCAVVGLPWKAKVER